MNAQQQQNNEKNAILSAAEAAKIQAMTPIPKERNKFIEELCQMFFDIFSDYWRLGTICLSSAATVPQKKSSKHEVKTFDDFYTLIGEILITFSDIVRAAFIPHTFKPDANEATTTATEKSNVKSLFHPWPIKHDEKIISQILPHCLRVCRSVLNEDELLQFYHNFNLLNSKVN